MTSVAITKPTEKPLPFLYQFTAGAVAGVSEILVMYPLDVVKTRFQLQVGTGGEAYSSILDCFQKIIKKEGFSRLYRGILPPILVEAPKRAIKFSANEQYSTLLKKIYGVDKMNQPLSIQAGIAAGCTEAVVIVPFELVKIRLQDKANTSKYNGTLDALSIFALYNGLEATIWRHATWNGGYFGVIFSVRKFLPKAKNKQAELRNNFIAGAIGGTFGTMINTPFDVVKTRIQNDTNTIKKYNWALPSLKIVAQEEGFKALYKGFVPKVLRLGPGGGILLVVFDQVTTLMKKHLDK
ncbi:126_t:CDS:2 [Entrophospora sp. SA101]|nr:126_t:CDS:2 [Entrophospora sp. SA101]CAJ0871277.1 9612_t:CDS:2 [Entrophospora sp. SA101]CAJ0912577.1 15014_t:CDS:2 [Entrophospora sp. SA101]